MPLAHLVKAEIVSPYCGILINTGMGNPTVSFTQSCGISEFFKASGEALDIRGLYMGIRIPLLHPRLLSSSALPFSSSSAQALVSSTLSKLSTMSGSAK